MRARTIALALACVGLLAACDRPRPDSIDAAVSPTVAAMTADAPIYVCPMDRDIRSHDPGSCRRCGMKLITAVPDPVEYHLELTATPPPRPNQRVHLEFSVFDPWKNNRVTKFTIVHERLFHAFIVSRDLQFFHHYHPTWQDGVFAHDIALPRSGMYRVLADFYPEASTPQLVTKTLFVAGEDTPAPGIVRDYSKKRAENLSIVVTTTPEHPVAGEPTQLRVMVSPADGLETYLGAWAHMLAASDDLVDMLHAHPSIADGTEQVLFNTVFPRARMYRSWIQLQRNGTVNTAHFDIPVRIMPSGPIAQAVPTRVPTRRLS